MGTIKTEPKRTLPFSFFYLKYFVFLFIGVLAVAGLMILAFELLVVKGVVYPAYYAQSQARAAEETLAGAEEIDESLIPELCNYVVFDGEGAVRSGNIPERSIANAWRAVQEKTTNSGGYYYTVIAREGEYCALQYELLPQFRSPVLRRYLPNPQAMLLFGGLCGILLVVALTALRFGHTVKKKLAPLISATEKIQKEELDFAVSSSDIREIDAVLRAMEDMRKALKASLESQWRQEQAKKEQILALAHDLKTPLTLVRGNADLLRETVTDGEQAECVDLIEKHAGSMQRYVQTLVEITRDGYRLRLQSVVLAPFLEEAVAQLRDLCAAKPLEKSVEKPLEELSGERLEESPEKPPGERLEESPEKPPGEPLEESPEKPLGELLEESPEKPPGERLEESLEMPLGEQSEKTTRKPLRIETNFAYEVQQILIDRELFLRALINVFVNAVEYTEEGGTIFFEVRQEDGSLNFIVTDTGEGFSKEALKHATEQFFTGDQSRGGSGHVGMGLYMAKLVMEQHGGQLFLENSTEAGGARVCMRIFPGIRG